MSIRLILKINSLKRLIKTLQDLETEIYLPPIDLHTSSSEHAYVARLNRRNWTGYLQYFHK